MAKLKKIIARNLIQYCREWGKKFVRFATSFEPTFEPALEHLHSRVGRGSAFSVLLPLASTHHADRAAQATSPTLALQPGLKVLVVDDDAQIRSGLAALLQSWGAEVQVAEGLTQALRVLEHGLGNDLAAYDGDRAAEKVFPQYCRHSLLW